MGYPFKREKQHGKAGPIIQAATSSSTVEPPTANVLAWIASLPANEQRRNVNEGLRVKVKFEKTVNVNGVDTVKSVWYGGVVSAVSENGRKVGFTML